MDNETKFSPRQRLICCLCFGAYLFAYLIRINISIALPDITKELALSSVGTGGITSAFFWTYAVGQLVSGWLGDRISPKFMIGAGLSVSAVINVVFSFSSSLPIMTALWAINGIFQSMLWAPIMRTIVLNFEGKRLAKMTFLMSLTLVFGYSISWSASTLLKSFLGWRTVFTVPAVVAAAFVIVWFCCYDNKSERTLDTVDVKSLKPKLKELTATKLFPIVIALMVIICIVHGIIKESINVWLPTMMESVGSFSLSSTLGVLIIVPLVNFGGVMLMKFIMSRGKSNNYSTLFALLIISLAVSAVTFFVGGQSVLLVAFTVAMSGLMFAVNPVLTAYVPLDFAKWNCVATVAGFVDCTIYVGAALSGLLTGLLVNGSDWSGVTGMWAVVLIIGVIAALCLKKVAASFFSKR